jgi:hypothetical protein
MREQMRNKMGEFWQRSPIVSMHDMDRVWLGQVGWHATLRLFLYEDSSDAYSLSD